MRSAGLLVIALLLLSAVPAAAEDEEPNIEFFYPVVTRRPVIEREPELNGRHEKGRDGRETETAGAIELPLPYRGPARTDPDGEPGRGLPRVAVVHAVPRVEYRDQDRRLSGGDAGRLTASSSATRVNGA